VEKYGSDGVAQTIIWRMRIACLIIKTTNTHSEYVIFIIFLCNNGFTKAPKCYVIVHCLCLL